MLRHEGRARARGVSALLLVAVVGGGCGSAYVTAPVLYANPRLERARDYAAAANWHFMRGELDRAEETYAKALRIFEEYDDERAAAGVYAGLGILHKTRGDLKRAEEMHLKALDIDKKHGDRERTAKHYANLGQVYHRRGSLALDHVRRSHEARGGELFEIVVDLEVEVGPALLEGR